MRHVESSRERGQATAGRAHDARLEIGDRERVGCETGTEAHPFQPGGGPGIAECRVRHGEPTDQPGRAARAERAADREIEAQLTRSAQLAERLEIGGVGEVHQAGEIEGAPASLEIEPRAGPGLVDHARQIDRGPPERERGALERQAPARRVVRAAVIELKDQRRQGTIEVHEPARRQAPARHATDLGVPGGGEPCPPVREREAGVDPARQTPRSR